MRHETRSELQALLLVWDCTAAIFALKSTLFNLAAGGNMRYRDVHERYISAKQRVKLAAERLNHATNDAEKQKAQRWVDAWDTVVRAHPLRRS